MSVTGDRFRAFFTAANGFAPYPWQCEVIERVASGGVWPDINVPTGAGKSCVVDMHVFLVGEHAAGRLDVRPPRRLVLAAPRRVLVDDQYERALRLAQQLEQADTEGPLGETAAALRSLWTGASEDEVAVGVWRMRGGVRTETGWRQEPAACQIICSTPQMWGSRLLFRGYAASPNSRNLETGLLCHDVVVIIDEAHLHERLVETARSLADRDPSALALQVVAMSATRAADRPVVTLSDADLREPGLSQRVRAHKHIERIAIADWRRDVEVEVIAAAEQLAGDATVGIFVNDVPTGLRVASRLGREEAGVVFVCGRLRPADVGSLRVRYPGLLDARGNPQVRFLISTQSLEVGVDLDLAAMVSMLAPASALAQRAGRLNRSGSRMESTFVVVEPEDLEQVQRSGPYAQEQLLQGRAWLDQLGDSIAPERVSQTPLPVPHRPVLPKLRNVDLETLAMTSAPQSADPEPDLYVIDPQQDRPLVGVAARSHLEEGTSLDDEVIAAALRACPPREHEIAELALGQPSQGVLDAVRERAWILRNVDGAMGVLRVTEDSELRPDDVLVIPSGSRICTAGVVGLGEIKAEAGSLSDVLHLADDSSQGGADEVVALRGEVLTDIQGIVDQDPLLSTRQSRRELAEALEASRPELARRLRGHRRLSDLALTWCGTEDAEVGLLIVVSQRHAASQYIRAVSTDLISLERHQVAVEDRLRTMLDALDLPDFQERPRLLNAARHHDDGKAHPSFQRRMGARDDELLLAKPRPGHQPDSGDGWRHEQLSAAYLDDELEIVIAAAHHGRGRPLFDRDAAQLLQLDRWPEWQCPSSVRDRAEILFGALATYESIRLRVQRLYGAHRLAWLEALLRCADMQVSREETEA